MKKASMHYAWRMVGVGMLMTAAGVGVFNSTSNVFVKPICEDLGFSRASFTLTRTIVLLVGAALMPLYGKLLRRYGVRAVTLVCVIGVAAFNLGYAFSTQLWQFYFFGALHGIFTNGMAFIGAGVLVSNWFMDRRGFASGLAFAGSGIGGALTVPLTGFLIQAIGWRGSYAALSLTGLLILVPTALFLIKDRPEDVGQTPYTQEATAGKPKAKPAYDLPFAKALRTPTLWWMMLTFLLLAASASAPNTHLTAYLTDIGYTTELAASIFSVFLIALTVGKIVLGILYDKYGVTAGNIFLGVMCILFPTLALWAAIPSIAVGTALLFGLASAGYSIPLPVLIPRYFGQEDFQMYFSIASMVTTLSAAVAIPLMGMAFDATGSYRIAWIIFGVMGGMILFCLVMTERSGQKLQKKLQATAEK